MTETVILDGRLRCRQPADGYRFAVDSLLLAWFVLDRRGHGRTGQGLELGGGCGVVSATVLAGGGVSAADLVELQEVHHIAAKETARLNGLEDVMRCHHRDFRLLESANLSRRPDAIYANPPFYPVDAGRTPPVHTKAMARHEVSATMEDVLETSARLLPSRGRLYLTYPAHRLGELLCKLPKWRFAPIRLVLAWGNPTDDAARLVLEARKEVNSPMTVGPAIDLDGPWMKELCEMVDVGGGG